MEIQNHLEELDILGYTLIKEALLPEDVEELKNELERIWLVQEQEVEGVFDIKEIAENNIVRAPLAYSDSFVKAYNNSKTIPLIKAVLGDYFILSQENGVIVHPNLTHSQNRWHRDLSHMNFVSDPPLAINAFFCLTDFSIETGATQLLPSTHKFNYAPSAEYMSKHGISIEAKAGDVFLFNSMLFHRTGINVSQGKRIGLNHIYSKYILKQQIDIPALLDFKAPEDPFLSMLLGFDSLVPTTVLEYRKIRKASSDKKKNQY
jgi:ectoine hydroxylase-related dioxygenase (phytanoyl-CoA dioxygenase family)